MMNDCTADLGHPCDGGQDGAPCVRCVESEREALAEWNAYGRRETREAVTYEADMCDAGRGHLVRNVSLR